MSTKLDAIIRNAENQVAVALRNKVDRFVKSKKNRVELLLDIRQLTEDLTTIVHRGPRQEPLKPKKMKPLPSRDARKEVIEQATHTQDESHS